MHVFLETERLILRRFTSDDEDLLFDLDNDPDVMFYINGGAPVPREEIVDETLPAFLSYYELTSSFMVSWFPLREQFNHLRGSGAVWFIATPAHARTTHVGR